MGVSPAPPVYTRVPNSLHTRGGVSVGTCKPGWDEPWRVGAQCPTSGRGPSGRVGPPSPEPRAAAYDPAKGDAAAGAARAASPRAPHA